MRTVDLIQGTPEWAAFRAKTFNASEAPAMMGASKYMTRNELLRLKHSGIAPDVDAAQQDRFDAGHASEAAFLPHAEAMIGGDLYPVTGYIELDGMTLLASFDGLTMDWQDGYEHKLFNMELAGYIAAHGEPPPSHYWQLEHQLLVSGGERTLFVTSDGTTERCQYCTYTSKPERRAALIAGWKQFDADLAAYTPAEAVDKAVGAAVTSLPAVSVQVSGSLMVNDNFNRFEVALRDFIDNRLIRKPATDQEFADLDLQIKALKAAEEALDAAEAQMLAQVASVDAIKRTKDMLHKLTRDNRLMAEKLLTARKEAIKGEVVAEGREKLAEHIAALNTRLGKPFMPVVPANFVEAAKNKRTVESLRNAVDTELARAKIEASAIADRIQANLATLAKRPAMAFLFADQAQIVLKATDDFAALVENRIAAHEKAEADKLEAERARIRAEEQARADREAQARLEAAAEREKNEAFLAGAEQREQERQAEMARAVLLSRQAKPAPSPSVVPLRRAEPAQVTPPTLRLGVINDRLSPIQVTADGLAALGFKPSANDRASKLYHEHEFALICAALVRHIEAVQDKQAA